MISILNSTHICSLSQLWKLYVIAAYVGNK